MYIYNNITSISMHEYIQKDTTITDRYYGNCAKMESGNMIENCLKFCKL